MQAQHTAALFNYVVARNSPVANFVFHESSYSQFTLLPAGRRRPKAASGDRSYRGYHQRKGLQARFFEKVLLTFPCNLNFCLAILSTPYPHLSFLSIIGRIDWPALLHAAAALSQSGARPITFCADVLQFDIQTIVCRFYFCDKCNFEQVCRQLPLKSTSATRIP